MSVDLPVSKIGRVDSTVLRQLKKHKINTISQLASVASSGQTFEFLAYRMGIDEQEFKRLINRARLRQINGIGTIFEILLELAAITSVADLAKRQSDELHRELARINIAERLSRRSPTPEEVRDWITAAIEMSEGREAG